MGEIKRCPHCGKTDYLLLRGTGCNEDERRDQGAGWYSVVCNYRTGGCGAQGGYRFEALAALAAWNERSTPETQR